MKQYEDPTLGKIKNTKGQIYRYCRWVRNMTGRIACHTYTHTHTHTHSFKANNQHRENSKTVLSPTPHNHPLPTESPSHLLFPSDTSTQDPPANTKHKNSKYHNSCCCREKGRPRVWDRGGGGGEGCVGNRNYRLRFSPPNPEAFPSKCVLMQRLYMTGDSRLFLASFFPLASSHPETGNSILLGDNFYPLLLQGVAGHFATTINLQRLTKIWMFSNVNGMHYA